MDTVLALALLSLGMFLMVVVTGLVYLTSIRPRLLMEDEESPPGQGSRAAGTVESAVDGAGGKLSASQEDLQQILNTLESGQKTSAAQEAQLMQLMQQITTHLNDQDVTLSTIISRLEAQPGVRSDGVPLTDSAGLVQRVNDLSEQLKQLAGTLMGQDEMVRQIHAQMVAGDASEPLYIVMGRQGTLIKELSDRLAGFDTRVSGAPQAALSGISAEVDAYTASVQELKKQLADQQTTISETLKAFASDRSLTAITSALRDQAEKIGKLDARIDEQNDVLTQTIQSAGEQKSTLDNISSQLQELVPDIDTISKRKTRVIRQPNRLTDIKGIGPVYAGMLHEAGIQTFKQLASFTPDQLKDLIDAPGWRGINAESWIDQAKILAEIADKVEADS